MDVGLVAAAIAMKDRWSKGAPAAMVVAVVLLSACSTTPVSRSGETAPRKSGGYYLDDGPGANPPPDLDLLPDAVPRVEKFASGANRPYNVFGVDYTPDLSGKGYKQRGVGSWYGRKFHGQRTSSGEIYDMYAMTAAHPTLPIPCYALVTNLRNGRSVIVRVNDRGPFLHNRVMDLSYAAALKVGYLSSGSGMIEVEMLMPADIAAGRIPVTTTSLLASASMPASAAKTASLTSTPATPSSPPAVSATAAELTIEALIAKGSATPTPTPTSSAAALPPAPTLTADASSRSLPRPSPVPPGAEAPPTVVAAPDRQPSLPEIATGSGFYLQLGAFRAKSGADSFAALVGREIDPAIASRVRVVEGAGFYRVRVGPYPQRADADGAAASLRAAIAQPVLVMPEGVPR